MRPIIVIMGYHPHRIIHSIIDTELLILSSSKNTTTLLTNSTTNLTVVHHCHTHEDSTRPTQHRNPQDTSLIHIPTPSTPTPSLTHITN